MDDATTLDEAEQGPFWKNPWVLAFALGALMVTCIAPRTRYVPRAPEVTGGLTQVSFVDATGDVAVPWSDGAAVVAFVPSGDPATAAAVTAVQHKLWSAYAAEGVSMQLVTVSVGGEVSPAKAIAAALHGAGGARPTWRGLWTADSAAVSAGLAIEATPWEWLTIVDGEGQTRGNYPLRERETVSEVYHRSRHVQQAASE